MQKNFTLFSLCAFLALSSASAQNTAISLNGTSNYVATTNEIVPVSGDFTVEFWAYTPSIPTGKHQFVSQGTLGGSAFYIGYDGNNPGSGVGNILVGDAWGNTGIPMPVGQWVHIAVTYAHTGTTATLYLNGVQKATLSTFSIAGGGADLKMGAQTDNSQLVAGRMDELKIWGLVRTPAQLKSGLFGTDPSTAGLRAYFTMNDNTAGTDVANSSTSPDVVAGDGTWISTPAWIASPIQSGQNAINLDGVDDQVNIPNNAAYDLSGGGTIEMWIYPTSLSGANSTLIGNRGVGGARYSFHISSGNIALWNGSALAYFDYTATPIPLNTWSHLAFVYDGVGNTAVYLNGAATPIGNLGTLGSGAGGGFVEAFGGVTGQPLTLGISKNNGPDGEPFTGGIDEVRLWSSQQTPAQILANRDVTLTGSETNLVGLFSFDEGIPDGDNSFLTTVIDKTVASNNATLTNLALTGSTSNFTTHTLTPLPVNFTSFTVTGQNNRALLQWQTAQEQNSRDYTIQRSADGANFTAIGTVPAAGNSSSPLSYSFVDAAPVNGKNYYRLKETDLDNQFMYSIVRVLNFSSADYGKLVWFQTGDKAVEVDLKAGSNELYTVTDISGRILQQGQLSSGKLYLTQLPGGMYVVSIITFTGKHLDTKVIVK